MAKSGERSMESFLLEGSLENAIQRWFRHFPEPPVRIPSRDRESHKGDFGRVLLVGGSRGMAGSISLSAVSCLRSGAGLVTAAVPDRCLETVAGFHPCIMTMPFADTEAGEFSARAEALFCEVVERFDVVVMGPGMGTGEGSQALVSRAVALEKPLVLDADALNVLGRWDGWRKQVRASIVMTPHPGEFQRLSGLGAGDRVGQESAAREMAAEVGCVILLKGPVTFVTDGEREYRNQTGNPGMASGGSGDCLTGLIGALLGQGLEGFQAAAAGAWAHGVAGDLAAARWGEPGMTAAELQDCLPWAIAMLQGPIPNVDLGP